MLMLRWTFLKRPEKDVQRKTCEFCKKKDHWEKSYWIRQKTDKNSDKTNHETNRELNDSDITIISNDMEK